MATHRRLAEPMRAFHIEDPQGLFPMWDPGGALRHLGHSHFAGYAVIYASEHYSTAMLENLVHHGGALPPNQHFVEVTVPAGVSYEVVTPDSCPGLHAPDQVASRDRGRS